MGVSKFKKYKSWGPWNIASLVFAICLALVGLIVAATAGTTQGLVSGGMMGVASAYAGFRYFKWHQEYARQFVFYSSEWGCNVWCTGERARERWSFGVGKAITDAIAEVASRFEEGAHVYYEGLRFEIVDKPFDAGGTLAMGAYYPGTGLIKMAWPEGVPCPPTRYHELVHVIVAERDGLDGNEATHQRMREMANAGIIPREWT